jgi:hypothetical protein
MRETRALRRLQRVLVAVLVAGMLACGSEARPPAPAPSEVPSLAPAATPGRPTPLGPHAPRSAVDLDGDARADIVVESAGSGGAGVYLGGATPRLASFVLAGPDVAPAFGRDATSAGDVDGNGWADVVIADELYHHVLVYRVGPDGVSAPQVLTVPTDGAPIARVHAASAGDVNEDGFGDLVVGSTNAIYLHFGSADGLAAAPMRLPGTGGYGSSVTGGADVNGDGHTDVVVGAPDEHAIYVHLGDGHGLGAAVRLDAGGQQMGDDIAMAGDVNHDGFADVVTSGYGGNGGWIFYGSRAGLGPTATALSASGPAGWSLFVSAAGDVDGDGFDDVVSGGYSTDGAFLYRGSSAGLIAEPQRLAPLYPDVPWMYRARGVGDVNGDGFADVVIDNTSAPRFLYLGRAGGLTPGPSRLDARTDRTAPVLAPPPRPVTFPTVETACTTDADCVRAPKLDGSCCPLCAQYVATTPAWVARVDALCEPHMRGCAISCIEGAPPTVHCDAGHCVLRP